MAEKQQPRGLDPRLMDALGLVRASELPADNAQTPVESLPWNHAQAKASRRKSAAGTAFTGDPDGSDRFNDSDLPDGSEGNGGSVRSDDSGDSDDTGGKVLKGSGSKRERLRSDRSVEKQHRERRNAIKEEKRFTPIAFGAAGSWGGAARAEGAGGSGDAAGAAEMTVSEALALPAPDWSDVGEAPSWAMAGDLPPRVTAILEEWDRQEVEAAELIAAGIEVIEGEGGEDSEGREDGAASVAASGKGRTAAVMPEQLDDKEAEQLARAIALRLLTAMPRTRHELTQKMLDRDVPELAIETVLDRYEELKIIDDGAFAKAWVESRNRSKGFARSRLKQELKRKGVGGQDLESALEQIDPEDERARAQVLALKKLGHRTLPPAGPGQADRAERDKVLRRVLGFLARKGYPGGMAMSAARAAMEQHDAGERG